MSNVLPQRSFDSLSAWRGAQISQQPHRWTVELSQQQIKCLETSCLALLDEGLTVQTVSHQRLRDSGILALQDAFDDIRERLDYRGLGLVRLRGLPTNNWGEALSAMAFWAIGHLLGDPVSQNPQGERLGHVKDYDEEGSHAMVRRYRTAGNIAFHCDGADVVGLLCMQTAKQGGQSRIASSVTIFNEMLATAPALAHRLFAPIPLDLRDEQKPGHAPCIPILPSRIEHGHLKTFYHSEYFRSADRHADYRLDDLTLACLDLYDEIANNEEIYLDMWLEEGDVQLISNHTVVHSRTAYVDHDDPALKRHLLRLWLNLAPG